MVCYFQRLRDQLPIDPEHLEVVFDRLDEDRNGYLTLEEFTDGFGEYLKFIANAFLQYPPMYKNSEF